MPPHPFNPHLPTRQAHPPSPPSRLSSPNQAFLLLVPLAPPPIHPMSPPVSRNHQPSRHPRPRSHVLGAARALMPLSSLSAHHPLHPHSPRFSTRCEESGDREVQGTMLELLSQLDGFSSDDRIKVVAATNRADILDLALMRPERHGLIHPHSNPCHTVSHQVVAATNRADILDPALMRSGRLDRKIEFPHPTEEARARILQVR
ncbi:unnamed protein product [Closterium sp. NIES-64]|nr:unnamed protein product [Closterium sp. NIES-64]